jgi:cytochrome c oxidase cbb3-type subunit 3
LFAANCAVCHGPEAKGGRQFGAPNLADKVWLYGSSKEAVTNTVTNAHAGVMPAWGGRLDAVTIKMLAAYVHSLGGGEAFAAAPATEAPAAAAAASGSQ